MVDLKGRLAVLVVGCSDASKTRNYPRPPRYDAFGVAWFAKVSICSCAMVVRCIKRIAHGFNSCSSASDHCNYAVCCVALSPAQNLVFMNFAKLIPTTSCSFASM